MNNYDIVLKLKADIYCCNNTALKQDINKAALTKSITNDDFLELLKFLFSLKYDDNIKKDLYAEIAQLNNGGFVDFNTLKDYFITVEYILESTNYEIKNELQKIIEFKIPSYAKYNDIQRILRVCFSTKLIYLNCEEEIKQLVEILEEKEW